MNSTLFRLMVSGAIVLTTVIPVFAQRGGGRSAPAPAARPVSTVRTTNLTPTNHDIIHAFGLGPNAGLHSGAPLTPRIGFAGATGAVSTLTTTPSFPLTIGAPNTWFPSRTTGFSTAPLFPYASAGFPFGYGAFAREPLEETEHKPVLPLKEVPPDPNVATMNVRVPAGADVWVEGSKTGQSGTNRTYISPHLEPGLGYNYEIRARWTEAGKPVEATRQIKVHAGDTVDVDISPKK